MDVPIGNMTQSQLTWRWLIIILSIQEKPGKVFKTITAWKNITMTTGNRLLLVKFVQI